MYTLNEGICVILPVEYKCPHNVNGTLVNYFVLFIVIYKLLYFAINLYERESTQSILYGLKSLGVEVKVWVFKFHLTVEVILSLTISVLR